MRHTFRAQTLQKAMLQVAQNLGPDATVIRTAEVRVPHHDKPVGFEVTAEGIWQADEMEPAQPARTTPESDEENPNPIAPVELAKHPEFSTLNLEDCVEEIMVQLLDVVHQMNGIRKVHTHWSETRTLLEEAQREVERITSIWETTFSSGFPQAVQPAEALSAQPLWNRSERTVAALIGPSGSGKTTATLRIANLAVRNGVETGIIQWKPEGEFDARVNALTLTEARVPLRQASSKQEVMRAIFELSSCDLVLIDTEAHSPWDPAAVESVFESLDGPGMEFHLVLPATWDRGDWADSIDFYQGRIAGLIGSHVDRIQGDSISSETGPGETPLIQCWMDQERLWAGDCTPPGRQNSRELGKTCRVEGIQETQTPENAWT